MIPIASALWKLVSSRPLDFVFLASSFLFALGAFWLSRRERLPLISRSKVEGKTVKFVFKPVGLLAADEPQHKESFSIIGVEAWPVENCSYESIGKIEHGSSHQIALVDFLNDPESGWQGKIVSLVAKVTYYDSTGKAYLIVDRALWLDGSDSVSVASGFSVKLVLAIRSQEPASKAKVFTLGNRYDRDHSCPYEAPLKLGNGKAVVRLNYTCPKYTYGEYNLQESRTFDFKLLVSRTRLQVEPMAT